MLSAWRCSIAQHPQCGYWLPNIKNAIERPVGNALAVS